jgi:hypothetical protein
MRVLIVDTYYASFLSAHYSERPSLVEEPYEVQWRALMERSFGTSDAYSHFLATLGHEAHEVVVNSRELQAAWAREHGIRRRLSVRRRRPIVLAQAIEFEPDVVYVQDLNVLPPKVLIELRKRSRLLVGQIASEPPSKLQLAPFQLILTSFPHFVSRFRELGIASEYFRIGFDPRVLKRLGDVPHLAGAAFVGALGRSQHSRGNGLLEQAARRAPIDFWGYGAEDWPPSSPIRRRYRGEAWGLDMYRVLAGARIALNRHIDVAGDYANNMRLYEATGVGALLLTDAKSNLGELFEPEAEVVTYASIDELVEKIGHYLADEEARVRIARAGQQRTLGTHTYAERMRELEGILVRYLD